MENQNTSPKVNQPANQPTNNVNSSINPLDKKDKIINLIKAKGPSLPIHISKEINSNLIIAGAFLSDLASEKRLKISSMKVGSSPLYFLPGQEKMLENFHNYLHGKEKEAFLLLKEKAVLKDEEMQPAIRVAMRQLRDFAFPLKKDGEIYWRFFSLAEQDALSKIPEKPKQEVLKLEKIEKPEIKPKELIKPIEKIKRVRKEVKAKEIKEKPLLEIKEKTEKPIKIVKVKETPEFAKKIVEYLKKEDIELLEELEAKKKEYLAKVRINSQVGKMEFLCIAKDKKKINETDLSLAYSKSQNIKLPILFMTKGELNKKAQALLEKDLKGYLTIKKIE